MWIKWPRGLIAVLVLSEAVLVIGRFGVVTYSSITNCRARSRARSHEVHGVRFNWKFLKAPGAKATWIKWPCVMEPQMNADEHRYMLIAHRCLSVFISGFKGP